jgi:glycosyltransferase involved in cell wall biosynthesis
MTLAVVIPTLNEEIDLPDAIASVKFADEVLIVDSGSTDKTISIAKKAGAKVIHHPFASYSETRNFADQNISSDWILSIDADVSVPSRLAQEITNMLETNINFLAFRIGRINIIWGKPILHADWGPKDDCHIRLYRRGSGKWQSSVHEQFITDKPVGVLKNLLVHQNYRTVSEFIEKTNSYSSLDKHHYQFRLWLVPIKDFLKRYFYKFGFLDGYHGLFLSYLQAIYHLNVLVKTKTR